MMLSGESANGQYPAESIAMQAAICEHTEGWAVARGISMLPDGSLPEEEMGSVLEDDDHAKGIGAAACLLAQHVEASAILCFDAVDTGRLARAIARHRPPMPIAAMSDSVKICRQLAISRGVSPLHVAFDALGGSAVEAEGIPDSFALCSIACERTALFEPEDKAVVVIGDQISVEVIGEHLFDIISDEAE